MGKKVVQLLHTLAYGDAISTEALALKRTFAKQGLDSQIVAIHRDYRLTSEAILLKDSAELLRNFSDELILHYSLGSPLNSLYADNTKATRSVIYHNLTPPHWFEGVNPRVVADINNGIVELPKLLKLSDRIVSDSKFNASEIKKLGFHSEVLEIAVDPKRWDVESDVGYLQALKGFGALDLLHVGRIAPNKCIEDIIKVFYFLKHYIHPHSRLWLVGVDTDTELYSFSLKRLMYELSLEGAVNFLGQQSDSQVRAMYEGCSVYLCMSEHEGFCLPIVEAMRFGLPVIAYASSAVPDTVGSGGILVHEKRHAEIASLCSKIHLDRTFKERLSAAGKARLSEMSFERFESGALKLFSSRASAVGA
jgi:glycosyltransferase involved in cell wall biosynthesis